MIAELASKLTALLTQEKYRLDCALGKAIREGRANLVLQGYSKTDNILLHRQEYEADIQERLTTLLTKLSQVLSSASAPEIRDNRLELEELAKAWLQAHIDDCQARLNELAERDGLTSPNQFDLDRERLLNALKAELSIRRVTPSAPVNSEAFVDPVRIEELSSLPPSKFDVSRLVRLCKEINLCFRYGCFHAVAFITRAILDHIPPVFGFQTFADVASQYKGGKSFKKAAAHLQDGSRNVCDLLLHMPIRKSETLPTFVQVDVHQQLDTVLAEVVRIGRQA